MYKQKERGNWRLRWVDALLGLYMHMTCRPCAVPMYTTINCRYASTTEEIFPCYGCRGKILFDSVTTNQVKTHAHTHTARKKTKGEKLKNSKQQASQPSLPAEKPPTEPLTKRNSHTLSSSLTAAQRPSQSCPQALTTPHLASFSFFHHLHSVSDGNSIYKHLFTPKYRLLTH